MNAGKTTTAVGLIKGLRAAGLDVGAAKVTGTGAGGDVWSMLDAGAFPVVDFTDAGFPSTYRLPITQVEQVLTTLVEHVSVSAVDAIVLEVADGLYQDETAGLLTSATFATLVAAVLFAAFAANDAMGAMAGVEWLRQHRLPVLAVSGALTQSPLAMREAQQATHLPVLDLELLCSGDWLLDLRQVDAHGCVLTIQHAKLPTAMLGTSGASWAACPRGA
jgi:hypothetical protein